MLLVQGKLEENKAKRKFYSFLYVVCEANSLHGSS